MAARRRSRPGPPTDPPSGGGATNTDFGRLTNLVALLLVKGDPQPDQIRTLAAAGFGNSEIASLLGLTRNAVAIALHRIRRKR